VNLHPQSTWLIEAVTGFPNRTRRDRVRSHYFIVALSKECLQHGSTITSHRGTFYLLRAQWSYKSVGSNTLQSESDTIE